MKNLMSLLKILFLALIVFSCEKNVPTELVIPEQEYVLDMSGGVFELHFTTNKSWTATSSAEWCKLSVRSGEASAVTIKVTLDANTSGLDRVCYINIVAGEDEPKVVTIMQRATVAFILLTQDTYVDSKNNVLRVELEKSVEYVVDIDVDWIKQIPSQKDLEYDCFYLEVEANLSFEERVGVVTIREADGGGLETSFRVTQSGAQGIILLSDSAFISSQAQDIILEVISSVDELEIVVPEYPFGMVTSVVQEPTTNGSEHKVFIISVSENIDNYEKMARIEIRDKNHTCSEMFYVIQSAHADIRFDREKVFLSTVADEYTLAVFSNITLDEPIIPVEAQSYISFVKAEPAPHFSNANNYTFKIEKNTSGVNRTAMIGFGNAAKGVLAEIEFVQPKLEPNAFIIKWNCNASILPLYAIDGEFIDCTIDWGDGNIEHCTDRWPSHSYAGSGQLNDYIVSVVGRVPGICPWNSSANHTFITKVLQWGRLEGLTSMAGAFLNYINLEYLPESDPEGFFANVTDLTCMFYGCKKLKTVPEATFHKCSAVTNVTQMFAESAIEEVPEDLFAAFVNVTDYNYVFHNCQSLKTVPGNLFRNSPLVNSYDNTFSYSAIEDVPENLFSYSPEVEDFLLTFYACSSLISIPPKLFEKNTKVKAFTKTFERSALQSLPHGLFDNCTKVESFYHTFADCSLITIPDDLFANCTRVEYFNCTFLRNTNLIYIPWDLFKSNAHAYDYTSCFLGCSNLRCSSPQVKVDGMYFRLWERPEYPVYPYHIEGGGCFGGCEGLSDYDEIPDSWK